MNEMRYIVKLPTGYQVKLARIKECTFFSATKHGDEKAMLMAKAHRDRLVKEHNYDQNPSYQYKRKSSNAELDESIAGVRLYVEDRGPLNYPKAHFYAQITSQSAPGGAKRAYFSIRIHGYANAFRKALQARIEATGLKIDVNAIPLPKPSPLQYLIIEHLASDIPKPGDFA